MCGQYDYLKTFFAFRILDQSDLDTRLNDFFHFRRSGKRDAAQVLAIFGRDGNYRVPPPVESGQT